MKELFRRRRLPHWDKPGAIYFVTACLADSISAKGLLDITQYRKGLDDRAKPDHLAESDWQARKWKQTFARCEYWLDQYPNARHLQDERLAHEVGKALLHFAGQRYAIWAYVIMPSHFHWVFEPLPRWVESVAATVGTRSLRERIMHSVKLYSARKCNQILGRSGKFWQDESYDHCVEGVDELERVIHYVESNPIRSRLCASPESWRFSSAWLRNELRTSRGRPVIGETSLAR